MIYRKQFKNIVFNPTFNKKMIVLIDGSSISQSETLAMLIKTYYPKAIFVGRPTAGSNGNIVMNINLPGGVSFSYSSIDFHYADGTQLQRIGVLPDIYVDDSIEGIKQGKDELLEKAISIINN